MHRSLLVKPLQNVSRSNSYVARRVGQAMSDRHYVNDLKPLAIDDHEGRLALVREILKAAAVALKVTWACVSSVVVARWPSLLCTLTESELVLDSAAVV